MSNAFREAHRAILPGASLDALAPVALNDGKALAGAVADFLRALDGGHLGADLRCGGQESAFVAGMREELAAYRADRALVARAHERGREIAADLYDGGAR